jgi:PleD family two-component response regulator
MIDITAFIMGTCRPQRLAWLEQTMDYLDSQNFPFVKKILAIDEFDGFTFPKRLDDKFADRGWIIIIDSHKSRVKSMDHAFELIDSEYVFYNEEDVMATMPIPDDLEYIFNDIK